LTQKKSSQPPRKPPHPKGDRPPFPRPKKTGKKNLVWGKNPKPPYKKTITQKKNGQPPRGVKDRRFSPPEQKTKGKAMLFGGWDLKHLLHQPEKRGVVFWWFKNGRAFFPKFVTGKKGPPPPASGWWGPPPTKAGGKPPFSLRRFGKDLFFPPPPPCGAKLQKKTTTQPPPPRKVIPMGKKKKKNTQVFWGGLFWGGVSRFGVKGGNIFEPKTHRGTPGKKRGDFLLHILRGGGGNLFFPLKQKKEQTVGGGPLFF